MKKNERNNNFVFIFMRIPEGEPFQIQHELDMEDPYFNIIGKGNIPLPNHFSFIGVLQSLGGSKNTVSSEVPINHSDLPDGIRPTDHTPPLFGLGSEASPYSEIANNTQVNEINIYELDPKTQTF